MLLQQPFTIVLGVSMSTFVCQKVAKYCQREQTSFFLKSTFGELLGKVDMHLGLYLDLDALQFMNKSNFPEIMTEKEILLVTGHNFVTFYHHVNHIAVPPGRNRIFTKEMQVVMYLEKLKRDPAFEYLAALHGVQAHKVIREIF